MPVTQHHLGKRASPAPFPDPGDELRSNRHAHYGHRMLTCLSLSQNSHTPGKRCGGGSDRRYHHSHLESRWNSSLGQIAPDISSQCVQPAQRRRLEHKEDSWVLRSWELNGPWYKEATGSDKLGRTWCRAIGPSILTRVVCFRKVPKPIIHINPQSM